VDGDVGARVRLRGWSEESIAISCCVLLCSSDTLGVSNLVVATVTSADCLRGDYHPGRRVVMRAMRELESRELGSMYIVAGTPPIPRLTNCQIDKFTSRDRGSIQLRYVISRGTDARGAVCN
jgi:hypothetical protein